MKKLTAYILAAALLMSILPTTGFAESGGLSSRLLAEYNFDDQTTDDSVGDANASLFNGAAPAEAVFADGIAGKALKLSTQGTEEKYWLSVPYSVFDGSRDSFTLSLWYKSEGHNAEGENSELFSLYNSVEEKFLFYGVNPDGSPNAFTMKWDGTYGYANVIGGYKENEWVHLAFAVEAAEGRSKITAYVNGTAVEVDQGGEWTDSLMSVLGIDTFTIGGKNPYKGGEDPKCLFYGAVDEVRLYSGVLTADEAREVYESALNSGEDPDPGEEPAVPGTLLVSYSFEDSLTDSVAGKNATVFNGADAAAAVYAEGASGKGLKLSTLGTEEKYWLSVPYSVFDGSRDSFTLSLWYKSEGHNAEGENSELFSLYNSREEKFLFCGVNLDGSPNAFTMKWDGTYGYANVIGGYRENEWVHLAFAVEAVDSQSKITAYVNGAAVEVDQGAEWAGSLMTALGIDTFTIGGKNPYKGGQDPKCLFYGLIDEVQLYAGALPADKVQEIYTAVAGEEELPERGDLLAHYDFNDSLADSVAGKNASLFNGGSAAEAVYTEGVAGQALQLSTLGTEEKYWLSVPYSVFDGSRDSFTLSIWYKAEGYNTEGEDSELFSLYNSGAEKFLFYSPACVAFQDKGFTMKWDGSYGYANVITRYAQGTWVHLAFAVEAVDGRSRITAYVNGAAVEVDQGGEWANSLMSAFGIDTFTIGGKNPYKGGVDPKCLFYGAVDEVRLYAGALTAGEVRSIYREIRPAPVVPVYPVIPTPPVEDEEPQEPGTLLASYDFEDSLENSVDGKAASLFNGNAAAEPVYAEGISGKALQLSTKGTEEKYWLSIPYSVFHGSKNSFTLSLWYKATGYNTEGEDSELFSLYNSARENFLFYSPAPAAFQDKGFTMKWDGSYGYANVITPYAENQWVHLAFAVEEADGRSKITAYVNGAAVEVDQGDNWNNSLMTALGINTFTIGGKNPYKGGVDPKCLFYGLVDEVQLYAGVLPADRVQEIYCAVAGEMPDPGEEQLPERGELLAYYDFNDSLVDYVGGKNAAVFNAGNTAEAVFIEGVSGKGLKLSAKGTDERYWLNIPYAVFDSSRDSFTVSLWYRAEGYNTEGEDSELFSFYNSGKENFLFYSPASTAFQDKGFTMKWDGSYGYANVIAPYTEGEWAYLLFAVDTVDGQSKITAYVNGAAVEVDQGGEWAGSLMSELGINTFTLGGKNPYKGDTQCTFYGAIDELQLYAGALTPEEAQAVCEAAVMNLDFDVEWKASTAGGQDTPGETGESDEPAEAGELLAYYDLNGSLQDSVGGKNASLFNASAAATPVYAGGISGEGLRLSTKGADKKYWLSIPYSVFGSSRDSFTLSMWYKAEGYNTAGEDSELFSLYNSAKENFLFYSPASTAFQDKGFTMKWDGSYGYANVITPYAENQWVHLAFAVENAGGKSKITAYVNGAAVEVDQGGEWAGSLMSELGIDTFTVGGKNPYKGDTQGLFYGVVDEIRLYAGTLTAGKVKRIYEEELGAAAAVVEYVEPAARGTLLAHYSLDETLGDSVGKKTAALFNGSAAATPVFTQGVAGQALQLSAKGTGEKYWLNIPYSVFGGNRDAFTLSLWYKAENYNTAGEDSELFSLYNSTKENFLFYSPASTAFQDKGFTMKWDGTYGYANVITPYAENEWVHLIFVVEETDGRSRIKAYVNGTEVEVDQGGEWAGSLMSEFGIDTFTVGGKNPYKGDTQCAFYGAVDEIALYAGALTAEEAQAIYEKHKPAPSEEEPGAENVDPEPGEEEPGDGDEFLDPDEEIPSAGDPGIKEDGIRPALIAVPVVVLCAAAGVLAFLIWKKRKAA